MKSILKSIIITSLFVFSQQIVFAQDADKTVVITVSGSGKTQEDAKQSALRSAIEQAFGAFISSKTEILNDQVVADQIASVANGNIQSFSILNESQLPDGSWGVTLKAMVSVSKLTSFIEAKGIAIEIKGGLFALNIKQQLLNEQGEINAVCEMVGLLHEPMQISFDYVIKSSDPKSLDAESKNWEIPLVVTATTNKNIDFCANYCIKTLSALSLSTEEVISYKSLNKAVFPVIINYNGVAKTFYLRKQNSINALNTLTSQWNFYTRLFIVQSGMDETNGNGKSTIHNFDGNEFDRYGKSSNDGKIINFLSASQQAALFSWEDKRTLTQIEQMTGYKVKPRGVVSHFKHGGFVVYEQEPSYRIGLEMKGKSNEVLNPTPGGIAEKSGLTKGDKIISINDIQVVNGNIFELINKNENKGTICEFEIDRLGTIFKLKIQPVLMPGFGVVISIIDLGSVMDWNTAKASCDELILNGYSDWHLPELKDLYTTYIKLKQNGIGGFLPNSMRKYHYWCYDGSLNNIHAFVNFEDGYKNHSQEERFGEQFYRVRPFRTFLIEK
jgi:hypothetical protein